MDEKSLYAHILNLSDPWQVKSLSLDENAGSVTVTIEIAENTRLAALQQLRYLLQLPEMSSAFLACLLLMIMKWPVRLFPVCLLMLDTLSRLQPRLNEPWKSFCVNLMTLS